MKIIKEELQFEESLKHRLEFERLKKISNLFNGEKVLGRDNWRDTTITTILEKGIYKGDVELKNEISAKYDEEEIKEKITKIQSDFLDIYNHKDNGDDENSDNKNMGN